MNRVKTSFGFAVRIFLFAGILLLVSGCSVVPTYTPPGYETAAPPSYPQASVDPSAPSAVPLDAPGVPSSGGTELDKIKVGDRLVIVISDTPPPGLPQHEVTVSSDGTIGLPHNKSINAAGKTRDALAQEIHELYVPSYYKNMTVTIRQEDRFFTVGGEVRNPSRQLYVGTMTVLKAIASVGGFTEFANKRKVDVTRSNGSRATVDAVQAQEKPTQFDIPIYPGDHIYVHRRYF